MKTKHIYCVDDDYYFVAHDTEHVIEIYEQEVDIWGPDRLIEQIPDDQIFEIALEGFEGSVDSGNIRVPYNAKVRPVEDSDWISSEDYKFMAAAPAGEWAEVNPLGGLCQTIWD